MILKVDGRQLFQIGYGSFEVALSRRQVDIFCGPTG
tara:strand:- start:5737 stop:5844 length:108 start_codon:yes stop_codon:yes gene_type:complete